MKIESLRYLTRTVLLICFGVSEVLVRAQTIDQGQQDILTPEERTWLTKHPDIALGIPTSYPPLVIEKPDGQHVGMLVDLFDQVSRRLNSRIRLHIEDSWADIQEKARNREIDGLALGGIDPSRDSIYNATDIVLTTYFSVFGRSQNEYQLEEFSDVDGLRIGYKRGARPLLSLLETLPSAIIVPYENNESLTQGLLTREIDVAVAWMSYDHWRKERLQGTIDNILLITEYPIEMVSYIRNDWPELIPIFNKALVSLQEDELPRITNKWFGDWPQSIATNVSLTPEEQAWLDENHTVRVRVGDEPPWHTNTPEPGGMVVDYLTIIGQQFDINFTYVPDNEPWPKSFQDIAGPHLRFDLYPTATRSPENLELLAMTENYLRSPWVVFTRNETSDVFSLEDLRGRKIVIENSSEMRVKLENSEPEIELIPSESAEDALLSLSTRMADAYVGNLVVTSYLLQRSGITNIKVASPTPYGDHNVAMATRKEWAPLISIIDKALRSIPEEDKTAIRSKYLSIQYEQGINKAELLKWGLIIGGSILTIILIFIFWNRKLSREIGRRIKTELELTRSKEQAETANRAKSIFLASMSHELRTPLNAILGFTRLMSRNEDLNSQQLEQLKIINRSGEHLLDMIGDILVLSRIEAGRIDIIEENFDLQQTIDDVTIVIRSRAEGKGLTFRLKLPDTPLPNLKGDANKLRQVLLNLLDNAVKYTEEGEVCLKLTTETVETDSGKMMIRCEVADNGLGIEPKMLEEIFDPFFRAQGKSVTHAGVGLGLSISKSLIDMMGGELHVESELDKGTRFNVDIQMKLADDETLTSSEQFQPEVIGLKKGQPEYRILVVDDNRENLRLLTDLLTRAGFSTEEAENGEVAINKFKEWDPHFIWMDLRMPIMDGYETTRRIRELPGGDKVRIVAVTASVIEDQKQIIQDTEIDDLVLKPFRDREIFDVMARELGVEYIYKDVRKTVTQKEEPVLSEEMLADLPAELLEELDRSTLIMDREATLAAINRIEEEKPEIAAQLNSMVTNFQMGHIRELLKKAETNEESD